MDAVHGQRCVELGTATGQQPRERGSPTVVSPGLQGSLPAFNLKYMILETHVYGITLDDSGFLLMVFVCKMTIFLQLLYYKHTHCIYRPFCSHTMCVFVITVCGLYCVCHPCCISGFSGVVLYLLCWWFVVSFPCSVGGWWCLVLVVLVVCSVLSLFNWRLVVSCTHSVVGVVLSCPC